MCGILTILTSSEESKETLEKIKEGFEVLKKRGPDNYVFEMTSKSIYGFTRLSIIDTTDAGNQPFISNNITMFCNGEIYNHKKLEDEFQLECNSKSDCECILELYKKFGFFKTVNLLDGVFAIVIIDGNNMYFARDRIGVRPLFYGITPSGNIALASVAGVISDYCTEVKNIKPGIFRYNKLSQRITTQEYDYPSYQIFGVGIYKKIKDSLTNAVQKRLMTDRNMCCMLSGGLDSSLITSILCKLMGPDKVRTYSIGMEGSIDLKYAKTVSSYLGTTHTEVVFTPEEGFAVIPQVIRDLETYDITTIRASVGMWLLSKYITENTDDIVIFSGEGSDELLLGYLYFHYAPSAEEANKESIRLVDELYKYDVLRADRSVSSHGLEVRVPFLDKEFVNLCKTMPLDIKIPINGIEKYTLRKSFEEGYLPDEVLWRRKDGYSDGVSGTGKKWYEQIKEFVEDIISDEEYYNSSILFPSKEAYYYKKLYDEMFPTYRPVYEYWMPKWVECNGEPSGRILDVYNSNDI